MLKNLTPHAIKIVVDTVSGDYIQLAPSGVVARISSKTVANGMVDGIPVFSSVYGDTIDLPSQEVGVSLVVSSMVLEANKSRTDLYAPGELIRDSAGVVIGCKGLRN